MKLFTCTALAKSHDASENKIFISDAEFYLYGFDRHTSIELNITETGFVHLLSGFEFTIDDLEDAGSKIFETIWTYDVTITTEEFFKEITIHDLKNKIQALKDIEDERNVELQSQSKQTKNWVMNKLQDAEAMAEFKHSKAMKLFASIQRIANEAAKAKKEALIASLIVQLNLKPFTR